MCERDGGMEGGKAGKREIGGGGGRGWKRRGGEGKGRGGKSAPPTSPPLQQRICTLASMHNYYRNSINILV